MNDPDDDFAPPPPRPRFRRTRKAALWLIGIAGAIALVLFLGRWQVGRLGERQLRIETAKLDDTDPGWKLDAILAERQKAKPDGETAATAILSIADELPDDWKKWRNSDDANKWLGRRGDNRLPPAEATEAARRFAADTHLVRARALRLSELPPGAFPMTIAPNPYATLLPHIDKARQVLSLLQYDAHLAALEKNPNRGVRAARAALAVGRAIGDEPFLVSQLVRIAAAVIASHTALQVLAWGEPTEGLPELQRELLAEAETPFFLIGMRGERAAIDRIFRGLEDGTLSATDWLMVAGNHRPGPEHYAAFKAYRPLLPGDHAKALELSSMYIEAAKLPHHEQLAAMRAVPIPGPPPGEIRYVLTRLVIPATDKVAEAGLRGRAELLAAATGVACERFRRAHGRWPTAPAELVPAFLPAVPVNPFDAKPIAYRTFPDRIAVYFLWADAPRAPDEPPADFRDGNPPGAAYGCRLWNPDRRGRPPEEKRDP